MIVHFQTVLSPIGVHIMHDWKKLQFMTTKTFVPKQFMTCIVILNKSAFGTNQQFLRPLLRWNDTVNPKSRLLQQEQWTISTADVLYQLCTI